MIIQLLQYIGQIPKTFKVVIMGAFYYAYGRF